MRIPVRRATTKKARQHRTISAVGACFDNRRVELVDPASVGLEVWTSTGTGAEKDWREEISFWKKAGVTHVTLHNTFGGYHHKRMAGRSMTDHVAAMRRYRNAVADLL